ncbi:MAG: gliding motility protein GldM, partial [Chitinophagaceae bacterium]|nr:gliding motility protein GldM [Chitinophagaceae bacterium]
MALPKEPRQKMINMMYLVLTALLALNVSAEILNAFKTVNRSLDSANSVLSANNNTIYSSFEKKLNEAESRQKASEWKPKADKVKALTAVMYTRLADLRAKVKEYGGYVAGKKDSLGYESNIDAATRLMDKEKEGPKLEKELAKLKEDLLNVDPAIKAEFASKLPIDLSYPKSQTGSKEQDWTTSYFHMTPAIAAITILNKFENDVKASENQIVTFCHNKIGEVEVRYDKMGFVGGLSSQYLMPGEKLTVTAGLGATSSGAPAQISINGKPITLNSDGMAVSEFPVSGSGTVNVSIKYKTIDGKDEVINKPLSYTVGQPSGVAVSADKMNVLYIGVDNPLTITAGVGSEKVSANISGNGTISRVQGAKWVAKPAKPGEVNVNVVVDGKSTPVRYRVKYLPDPAAFVANKRGGPIPAGDLKAQGGMIARLLDSDFEAAFKVTSYTVGAVGGKYPVYQTSPNEGNRWSGGAATIINNATPGTSIFFDNIKVVGPDGRTRDLPQMSFN